MKRISQSERPLRIFLCHASGDKPSVRTIYKKLVSEGIHPWLDEENLLPGQDWNEEIQKAVRNSDAVIVCLSHASINKRGYVQKEIKYALDVADEQPEGSIFIIPLKLEECDVPQRLSRWQWVDYHRNIGYSKLIEALQQRSEALGLSKKKPTVQETLSGAFDKSISLSTAEVPVTHSSDEKQLQREDISYGKLDSNRSPIKGAIEELFKKSLVQRLSEISPAIYKVYALVFIGILVVMVFAWSFFHPSSIKPEGVTKKGTPPSSVELLSTPMKQRFGLSAIKTDTSKLSEGDRKALDKIIYAARLIDQIYLRQVWTGNVALEQKLEGDTSQEGKDRLDWFRFNAGPWSRLDEYRPFIQGVPQEKPPQAGFYPDDITREEFESWILGLSESDRQKALGYCYVIRRGDDRSLKVVPYSQEYRKFLESAANLLREAANLTSNHTLKDYLMKRAAAFLSNDYYASDIAWMDVEGPIDVVIGPYETYEDRLFGYKASYTAVVYILNDIETKGLVKYSTYLQEIEAHLPIDTRYSNPKLGAIMPIQVADEIFASGDGHHGVQVAAFNLPNDEKVIKERGSKRVLLKNVQQAKFKTVLIPISEKVIDSSQQGEISFDAFFNHILAHELMHGLGPHNIEIEYRPSPSSSYDQCPTLSKYKEARPTTVHLELKELYAPIEEAKADIAGLWALQYLIDTGKAIINKQKEKDLYVTYLASSFRSIRFGIKDAHGRGQMVEINYLLDKGAIKFDETKNIFSVDFKNIKDGINSLTKELLTLQARGSYEDAKNLIDKYGNISPILQKAIDRLKDVPLDIDPVFAFDHIRSP